jgi:hypothetical protein
VAQVREQFQWVAYFIMLNGYFEMLKLFSQSLKCHSTEQSKHVHLNVLYLRTFACLVKFLLFYIV